MANESGSGGLFRFRRSAIDRIVADRELMVRQAESRAEEAEKRLRDLERELRRLRNGNGTVPKAEGGEAGVEQAPRELVEALTAAIMSAAEATARPTGGGDGTEADDLRREVLDKIGRVQPWTGDNLALAEARARLQEVRDALRVLPHRLEEAFRPLARSLREAEEGLSELDPDPEPPLDG